MITNPILPPDRADRLRRLVVLLAAGAGLAAAGVVLSSQAVTDFLREGPVRVVDMEGERLRVLLGLGTAFVTMAALACFWRRPGLWFRILGGIVLAGGLFLIHGLLIPAVALFATAAGIDIASRISRERLASIGPRRYPLPWATAGLAGIAATVGLVWLTVWLASPLFDDGTELNETLAFSVEGLRQPEIVDPAERAPAPDVPAAGAEAPGVEDVQRDALLAVTQPSPASGEGTEVAPDGSATVAATDAPPASGGPDRTADAPSVTPSAIEESGPAPAEETPVPAPAAATATDTEPSAPAQDASTTTAATPDSRTGTLIARGNLQGADAFHTGSGDVLLVQSPDGEVILRFQDFEVRNGPDLHVYLSPDPGGDVHAAGAISLGAIKATSGFVNYDVPSGVDATIFRSVIIYCEPFHVVFATAVIG